MLPSAEPVPFPAKLSKFPLAAISGLFAATLVASVDAEEELLGILEEKLGVVELEAEAGSFLWTHAGAALLLGLAERLISTLFASLFVSLPLAALFSAPDLLGHMAAATNADSKTEVGDVVSL